MHKKFHFKDQLIMLFFHNINLVFIQCRKTGSICIYRFYISTVLFSVLVLWSLWGSRGIRPTQTPGWVPPAGLGAPQPALCRRQLQVTKTSQKQQLFQFYRRIKTLNVLNVNCEPLRATHSPFNCTVLFYHPLST